MFSWLIDNAATILIAAVLAVAVFFIARGMIRGRIKTCDCGSCAAADGTTGCAVCPFGGQCSAHGKEIS